MSEANVKQWCTRCGKENAQKLKFCTSCGAALTEGESSSPGAPPPPPSGGGGASGGGGTSGGGRAHSPAVALTAGLLIPGGGQAYNGNPIAGFFICLFSVLVLPWLIGAVAAYASAKRIVAGGGRFGMGGFVWLVLQVWLTVNVALAVVLGLTLAGVLK